MPSTHPPTEPADVELRLPADGAYVSVVRTTTAGLAARLDFTIDEIEDLRIAVGEACALVLPDARPATDLVAHYRLSPGEITVAVTVLTDGQAHPDTTSFAWQVLDTLASATEARAEDSRFTVSLTLRSELEGAGR